MPYGAHALVAFGGALAEKAAGDEIWQCGIRVLPPGGLFTVAQQNAYLASIKTPLQNWWFATANGMRNDATLAWIKCNQIKANGGYLYNVTSRTDYTTPVAGGGGAAGVPAFLSICFSWQTQLQRGLNAKGRIYPPTVGGYTPPGSLVPTATVTAMVASAKALLTVIANTAAADPAVRVVPVIAGPGRPDFEPAPEPITGVRVGNVYDEQRRRKNAVPETYTAAAWP